MPSSFLNSLINGLGRKTGFTTSSRLTEGLGKKIINPKSKLRKKIDKFELTGEFDGSMKRIKTLIEIFYEEYKVNSLPLAQIKLYLESDVSLITSKVDFLKNYTVTDEQEESYQNLINFWTNVKNEIIC